MCLNASDAKVYNKKHRFSVKHFPESRPDEIRGGKSIPMRQTAQFEEGERGFIAGHLADKA